MKKLSTSQPTRNYPTLLFLGGEPIIKISENFKYHNNYLTTVLGVNGVIEIEEIKTRIKERIFPRKDEVDFIMVYASGSTDAFTFVKNSGMDEPEFMRVLNLRTLRNQQFKVTDLSNAYLPEIFNSLQMNSVVELYNAQSLELEKTKKKLKYLELLVTNRTTNPPMFGRMYCDEITEEEINPKETVKQIKKDIIRDREMFTGCPPSKTKTITEEELKSITPVVNYQYTGDDKPNKVDITSRERVVFK